MNEKELKGLAKYLRPIIIDAKERGMTSIQLIFGKNHKKQLDALLALLDLAERYLACKGWPEKKEIIKKCRCYAGLSYAKTETKVLCADCIHQNRESEKHNKLIDDCRLAALWEKEGLGVEEINNSMCEACDGYCKSPEIKLCRKKAQAIHSAYERKRK